MSNIPNNWREWMARNYLLGVAPDIMITLLVENGYKAEDAAKEIENLKDHPYIAVINEYKMDLQKRDWLVGMLADKYKAGEKYNLKIDRKKKLPSFQSFLKNYYYENKPVLVENAISGWPAKNWTPELLKEKVGNEEVEVQYGREKDENFEQNSPSLKKMMRFHDFIDEILSVKRSNNLYLTANNAGKNRETLAKLYDDVGQLGDGYLDMKGARDSGFIWVGPEGTFTPTHHDLTNNLFIQIYGRKKFWLAPAIEAPKMYNSVHVFSNAEIAKPDYEKFPLLKNAHIMEVIVKPGDFLFIPIGWWHAVESMDISISYSSCGFAAPNYYHASYPRQGAKRY